MCQADFSFTTGIYWLYDEVTTMSLLQINILPVITEGYYVFSGEEKPHTGHSHLPATLKVKGLHQQLRIKLLNRFVQSALT